jgi:hypothetical protein
LHLRIIAPQLVAHAVGEAVLLLFEVVMHARPFAQLDHQRIVNGDAAKGMAIGAQLFTNHLSLRPAAQLRIRTQKKELAFAAPSGQIGFGTCVAVPVIGDADR